MVKKENSKKKKKPKTETIAQKFLRLSKERSRTDGTTPSGSGDVSRGGVDAVPTTTGTTIAQKFVTISKARASPTITGRQAFQASLLKRQGFTIVQKDETLVAVKGNKQVVITKTGAVATAPISALIDPKRLSDFERQKELNRIRREKIFIKAFFKPFGKKQIETIPEVRARQQIRNFLKKQRGRLTKTQETQLNTILNKPLREIPDLLAKFLQEQLTRTQRIEKTTILRSKTPEEKILRGVFVLGTLGLAKGLVGFTRIFTNPKESLESAVKGIKAPVVTAKAIGQEFTVNPVGVAAEFFAFNKALRATGGIAKRSSVGQFVKEELFIRSQPTEIQAAVRSIIRSGSIQKKINPFNVKTIKNIDFMEIKSLTRTEAKALKKTLEQTDSIIFGSTAARTLGKKRTPIPKDVDLATRNIGIFNRQFLRNLPKNARKNYLIKGEKIIRISNKRSLLDVKPIERLIPRRSLFTRKGSLPVAGFVKRLKATETIKNLIKFKDRLDLLRKRLQNTNLSAKVRRKLVKQSNTMIRRIKKELKNLRPSELPKIVRRLKLGKLEFATQKLQKVGKIKLVGFGEQTLRKALGTLQVLIEKNLRRAKDPQSFLIGLEVQLEALKKKVPITQFGGIAFDKNFRPIPPLRRLTQARQISVLENAIKLLKSKAFARLLEKQAPGITRQFPLLSKINIPRLKQLNIRKAKVEARKRIQARRKKKRVKPELLRKIRARRDKKKRKKTPSPTISPKQFSQANKRLPKKARRAVRSRLPSRLPSRIPVRVFSALPSVLMSRLPSRLRSILRGKAPSKLPSKIPSKLPPSKLPSKLPPPKTTASRLISKLPSRLRSGLPSKLIASPTRSEFSVLIIDTKKKANKLIKKIKSSRNDEQKLKRLKRMFTPVLRKFIFLTDMQSIIFGIKIPKSQIRKFLKVGRIFTGVEQRGIIVKSLVPKSLRR